MRLMAAPCDPSIDRYGDFVLTDAVRPMEASAIPMRGYRRTNWNVRESGITIPVSIIAASRGELFDVFLALLEPLGSEVEVVLESSHRCHDGDDSHEDLYTDEFDLPVLKSILCDFEELLTNDGNTGIAVFNEGRQLEVQFDEHKLLYAYAHAQGPFMAAIADFRIPHRADLRLITDGRHMHSSSAEQEREFNVLRARLGAEPQ